MIWLHLFKLAKHHQTPTLLFQNGKTERSAAEERRRRNKLQTGGDSGLSSHQAALKDVRENQFIDKRFNRRVLPDRWWDSSPRSLRRNNTAVRSRSQFLRFAAE